MKLNKKLLIGTAVASALTVAATTSSVTLAGDKKMEKCYGVVKAGNNDCQTSNSACAGTSTADGQKDAWLLVPKGMCARLVNGNTEAG